MMKRHNTKKWRLITDLSYLPGGSVNDSNDPIFALFVTPPLKMWLW